VIWSSHGARWPRRLIVLAIAALIPVLAGCEAGNDAPTTQWHQPTAGAGTTVGDIAIRNVFVLGAPLGRQLTAGQSAGMFFAVVNGTSPDKLLSISAPGAAKSVTLPGGTVSLADNQAVFLTGPAPKVILNDLSSPLSGSAFVRVIMTFQNAGSVTLLVPVVPRASYYATLSPAPTGSPSPSPTAKKHKKVTGASPSATPASSSPSSSTSP
jgi:copper(I)-binding protein